MGRKFKLTRKKREFPSGSYKPKRLHEVSKQKDVRSNMVAELLEKQSDDNPRKRRKKNKPRLTLTKYARPSGSYTSRKTDEQKTDSRYSLYNDVADNGTTLPEKQPSMDNEKPNSTRVTMDVKKPKKRKKRPLTLRKHDQTRYKLKKKTQDAGPSERNFNSSYNDITDKETTLPERQPSIDRENPNSTRVTMDMKKPKKRKKRPLTVRKHDQTRYRLKKKTQIAGPSESYVMTPGVNLLDECDTNEYATTNDDTKYDITNDDTKYDITNDDIKFATTNDDIKYDTTKDDMIKDDNINDEPSSFIENNYYTTNYGSSSWVIDDHSYCAPDTEYKIKVEAGASQPYGPEFATEYCEVEDLQSQLYVPEFPPDYCKVEDVRSQPYDPELPPDYCKVEDVSSQPYGPADFPSENCNVEDVQSQQYVPEFSPDNSKGENVPSQLHGPEFTPDFCKVVEVSSEPYDPAFPVEDCNVEDVPSQEYGPEFPTEYRELRDAIQMDSCPGQYEVMRKSAMIKFIEHYEGEPVIGKISVMVSPDYLVKIRVHGQEIQSNHNIWEHIPRYTSTKEAIFKVLLGLSQSHVCCGNPETEFTKHIPPREGLGESADRDYQEYIAFLETGFHTKCIRSKKCDLLIRNTLGSRALRCRWCQIYRSTLRKRKWREENKPNTPSKFTNNEKLSHSDLVKKASKLHTEKSILKREVEILKKRLEKVKRETKGENISELPRLIEDSGNEINEN